MPKDLDGKMPQMAIQLELPLMCMGEARTTARSEEASAAIQEPADPGKSGLMENVTSRDNLLTALKRVRKNKGSPGVDGMTVQELGPYLRDNWSRLREELLSGTYQPQAVRQKLIPKGNGKTRMLGIPTVVDRFIQQALLQALQPIYEPTFSNHSHGFRPKRSTHGALSEAREYVVTGREWVVDVDLSKFFDTVNHDILMGRLERRIKDGRILGTIRRYLTAGMMVEGIVQERDGGTPQGGPLSPLLANVLLDEVDQELERRGHAFVRYADDSRIFVRSKRAGERVMRILRKLYGRLKLVINEEKSAIAPYSERPFLGYSMFPARTTGVGLAPAEKSIARIRTTVRQITRRAAGRSFKRVLSELIPKMRGWRNYYRLTTHGRSLRALEGWIRRRLRALLLSQWRNPKTIARELRALGADARQIRWVTAFTGRWWRAAHGPSHSILTKRYFDDQGLPALVP